MQNTEYQSWNKDFAIFFSLQRQRNDMWAITEVHNVCQGEIISLSDLDQR